MSPSAPSDSPELASSAASSEGTEVPNAISQVHLHVDEVTPVDHRPDIQQIRHFTLPEWTPSLSC
jgi:hypothetical protein